MITIECILQCQDGIFAQMIFERGYHDDIISLKTSDPRRDEPTDDVTS